MYCGVIFVVVKLPGNSFEALEACLQISKKLMAAELEPKITFASCEFH